MKQIKVLIAHNSKRVKKQIKNSIENIEYVSVVDEVSKGKELLDRILKYEPDIVFTKYNMKDINMMDVSEITESTLQDKAPIIKFISNKLQSNTHIGEYKVKRKPKMITHVKELGTDDIIETIGNYYKENVK